ncbi:hypothetical protein AQUCO_01400805v1 [Aquilegia coerulea]|uniref:RNA polymerase sigma-70 domain-containing protein n=1 Tax=Aquilegia coerulea TaxID=218851 RepID=A0A2G5DY70_AQUCA|nr:hypothetical protein AQUCO_01400805v1 [Aquilegia coerulea]
MAVVCSSTNNSPNLSRISLYSVPTKPSIRSLQPLPLPSSSCQHIGLSLLSEDTLTTAAAAEAFAFADAAAQAARDALILLHEESEFQSQSDMILESSDVGPMSVMRRRRKRRKRQKEELPNEDSDNNNMEMQFLFRKSSSARLTPKEEAEFTLYLKEGARLEAARTRALQVRESDFTTSKWAKSLGMKRSSLERTLCKARKSKEHIIISYRRLVVSIATGYQGKGLSLQDLIQEGSIGLLLGAEKFDPKKGYKLSTYAYWWIKQAIIRAIANKSRLIRLPGSMCDMVPKIAEANNELSRRLQRQPTYNEISDMIAIHVSSIRLVCTRNRPPISLDQTLTDTGCMTLQDIISGPEHLRPEIMVNKQVMKKEIHRFLTKLTEREEFIVRLYYGLNGETARSCEEIARLLSLSRERVRQIHSIALTKLRHFNKIDNILGVYMT